MKTPAPLTSEHGLAPELQQQSMSVAVRGFERLRAFCEEYNRSAGQGVLDSSQIVAALSKAGALTDRVLKGLSEGEIAKITGQPIIIARAFAAEFQKVEGSLMSESNKRLPSRIAVQTYLLEDLVKRYDPSDFGSPVIGELRRRMRDTLGDGHDPRVVIFDDAGKVMAEPTMQLIKEAMQGDADLTNVVIDGVTRRTYRLGEAYQQVVSIQPISRELLRSNGQDRDGLNWSSVDQECKQLLFLAVESGELKVPISRRELVYYNTLSMRKDGFASIAAEFPRAAQTFSEKRILGDLPALKVFRNSRDVGNIDPSEVLRHRRQ